MISPLLRSCLAFTTALGVVAANAQSPAGEPAASTLKTLLDADLAAVLQRNPLLATVRGIPGYNHLLPDLSPEDRERERVYQRAMLEKLQGIDAGALRGQDRVSLELMLEKFRFAVEGQRFADSDALVVSSLGGIQNMMPRASQTTPFQTAADYRDYIARLSAMPVLAEQTITRLRAGLSSGWMRSAPVVDRVIAAIDAHLVNDARDSVLMGPFSKIAPGGAVAERIALAGAARRAIAEDYQPALRKFRTFLQREYRPRAPAEAGLSALPGGAAYYDFLIRSRIVGGMSAADIHALGLREVERLRGEIGGIARGTGFKGATGEFIAHLASDPKYFFTSADAVLAAHRSMAQRVEPQLPKLFRAIPRMPYAVRAMTPAEAASSTAANYTPGSLALGTSGYFSINARGYASEATWRTETLFVHEAVPGHHLQVARAAELEGLHAWRRIGNWNIAYGEGWALYAESLGFDLGLYADPYQHYGHLQAQLFRAARLVVDTGIHAYGWTRSRAVDYMAGEGGMDRNFAQSEVDRYFSNPAQALGYMLGKHKLLELRAKAERALGARFDLRDFHATLLDNGAVSLALLEKLVEDWIAGRGAG